MKFWLHRGGGHTAVLEIKESSQFEGRRLNVVLAKIRITWGSQGSGLPNEILRTPWGEYSVYKRTNRGSQTFEFIVSHVFVPVSVKRLEWLVENRYSKASQGFIRELCNANIPLKTVSTIYSDTIPLRVLEGIRAQDSEILKEISDELVQDK